MIRYGGNFFLTHSLEYVYNQNLETGNGLPFTPPISVMTEISWKPDRNRNQEEGFQCAVTGHYFAPQNRVDINEPVTDGYFLFHASASWKKKINQDYISLFLRANNLFDTYYLNNMSRYRILNLPEQGFNLQFLVRYEF
ncbi:MAG: TonB-dependent receptor [Taibaiella sp.]|nr:TonB-dependent receptor [Taibaiella sp.]